MGQVNKDFTYAFNIIYRQPVTGKVFKMFNKQLLIHVFIKKPPRAGWLPPSVLDVCASRPNAC